MKKITLLISICVALTASASYAAQYSIDPEHSTVSFSVRHVLSHVIGRFDKFSGSFTYDANDFKSWKTDATIDTTTINTNNEKRDKHLRSKDFFDTDNAKEPANKTIKFVSTGVSDVKGNKAKLHGKLTIHSVTKDVVLDLDILGAAKDPWGNKIAAFTAKTTINRKDYGLKWNQALETGGVLVGEEVEITLEISGLEQEAKK